MAEFGRVNVLEIVGRNEFGLLLEAGEFGEVLLPKKFISRGMEIGEEVRAFLFRDSEDRPIATVETPLAQVGDFASLQVKAVERVGAFLDWGLSKDLLLPFSEQQTKVREGQRVLVRVYVDEDTDRIVATTKLNRFLDRERHYFEAGQEVGLTIAGRTDLGYNVIVEQSHWGLVFENEVNERLVRGQRMVGYVKEVREDQKLNICLKPEGYRRVTSSLEDIFSELKAEGGFLPFNDNSSPDAIRDAFGMSKKTFKAAIGALYRERKIEIVPEGIRIVGSGQKGRGK